MSKLFMRLLPLLTLFCTLPAFASHEELYVIEGAAIEMIDVETGLALDSLPVDTDIRHVGFSVEGEFAYILLVDGSIVVIRTDTTRVTATIPPDESSATALFAVPTGNRRAVWVANDAPEIVVRDARSLAAISRIALPEPASDIRFSFDSRWAYVLLPSSRQLVAFDASTHAEVGRVALPSDPLALQVVRSGGDAGNVVVATKTGVYRYSAELEPAQEVNLQIEALLATPIGTAGSVLLWQSDGHIAVVDSILGSMRASAVPYADVTNLAATADHGRIYVAQRDGTVHAIDMESLANVGTAYQGTRPLQLAIKTTIRACF